MRRLRNFDIDHREKVFEALTRFVKQLKATLPVKEIYLYGSFATGEIHEMSDIDLIIVGDFHGRMFDRIDQVTRLTDLPVEPLVYREEEFQRKIEADNPFLKEILKTAKKL